jgi:hypothetical protein
MVILKEKGAYRLFETKEDIKILSLFDERKEKVFAWVYAAGIGEILITSHNPHRIGHILVQGKYRLYDVKNEHNLTDLTHLELLIGEGKWQGYLLPTEFPNDIKKRSRIIATQEMITKTIA